MLGPTFRWKRPVHAGAAEPTPPSTVPGFEEGERLHSCVCLFPFILEDAPLFSFPLRRGSLETVYCGHSSREIKETFILARGTEMLYCSPGSDLVFSRCLIFASEVQSPCGNLGCCLAQKATSATVFALLLSFFFLSILPFSFQGLRHFLMPSFSPRSLSFCLVAFSEDRCRHYPRGFRKI